MKLAHLVALLSAFVAWSVPAAEAPVRLLFLGDIMLDDGPGRTTATGGDPLAALDGHLRAADFAIGNLECPVAASGAELVNKVVTFRANPHVMRILKGRFAALSVANNHSGDYGHDAFLETLTHVRAAGIVPFGGGVNLAAAHAPLWLEKHGLRIAVLAYNEFKPRRFEAGATWPGIAWSEDSHVVRDIRGARAAGADVVIPFMHWGRENERQPSARQWQLARRMLDAGADAVIGAHPHVTQGAALYRGKPIVWSLGNAVFDGFDEGPGRAGWMLSLDLDRHGVRRWQVLPLQIDEAGTPTPGNEPAPCGQRGATTIGRCAVD